MEKDFLNDLKKQREALDATIEIFEKLDSNPYLKNNLQKLLLDPDKEQKNEIPIPIQVVKEPDTVNVPRTTTITTNSKRISEKSTIVSKVYQILTDNFPNYLTLDAIVEKLKKEYNLVVLKENISSQLSARLKSHNDLEKLNMNYPVKWRVKSKLITSELRDKVSIPNLKSKVFNFVKFIGKGEVFTLTDLKESQKIVRADDTTIISILGTYIGTYIDLVDKDKMVYKKRNI